MSRPWQEYCDQSSWHDAANIFPLMSNDEIKTLADDIKANGLKNPIILQGSHGNGEREAAEPPRYIF